MSDIKLSAVTPPTKNKSLGNIILTFIHLYIYMCTYNNTVYIIVHSLYHAHSIFNLVRLAPPRIHKTSILQVCIHSWTCSSMLSAVVAIAHQFLIVFRALVKCSLSVSPKILKYFETTSAASSPKGICHLHRMN